VLSIAQQWKINKVVEKEDKERKPGKKKKPRE
jgi:membrane protein insertase Oxa1/YidC/SpoIIIJ